MSWRSFGTEEGSAKEVDEAAEVATCRWGTCAGDGDD